MSSVWADGTLRIEPVGWNFGLMAFRLVVYRDRHWTASGEFTLSRQDWIRFEQFCKTNGIDVCR